MNPYEQYTKEDLIQLIENLNCEISVLNKKLVDKSLSRVEQNVDVVNKKRILHNSNNGYSLLLKTCDTLLLLNKDGICVDLLVKSNHRLIKEQKILDRNIFDVLSREIRKEFRTEFNKVLHEGIVSNNNYEFPIKGHSFYIKCIMQRFKDDLILCQCRDITQPFKLMKKLETLNLRLRETGETAMIGQWTYDQKTQITTYYGNVGGLYKDYAEVSMPITEYFKHVYPEDLSKVKKYMSGETEDSGFIEYRVVNGTEVLYFRSKIIQIRENSNSKVVVGYIQNIGDIIKKRNELQMVTNAVNMSNDIIFGARKDGVFLFANEQCRKFLDVKGDDNISEFFISDQIMQKHYPQNWADLIESLSKETVYRYTVDLGSDRSGRKGHFDCVSYLIQNEFGQHSVWSFWKNITKQTEAENQIKTTNRLLQTILDNIPVAIFVKDSSTDFRNVFINKEGRRYPLLDASIDPIHKTDFELFPHDMAQEYRNEDEDILRTKESLHRIKEITLDNGMARTVDELKLMVAKEDDDSALIIAIEWDISDIKKIEDELIKAKEKAEEADKLKSAFLSNMSHEIRTPLNAIVGFSRIIAETNDEKDRHKYYDIVESNNVRLLSLINEILDLSRIESGTVEFVYQDIELSSLLQELYNNLSLLNTPTTKIILDNSIPEIWINTDRNRLYQVFSNLITNAQKFTPKGEIHFGAVLHNGRIQFYVKDTGIGIPEDRVATIFDRFVKVNSNAPGTGLGLAICKTIMERLGGDISATSVLGEGTAFEFYLPYKAIENKIEKEVEERRLIPNLERGEKIKLLIVEKNETELQLINAMLQDNYILFHTADYKNVLDIIAKQKPHIVLVDIIDPSICVASAIRTLNKDIPIIALSSFAYDDDKKKMKSCGFNDVLIKPITKELLVETIENNV